MSSIRSRLSRRTLLLVSWSAGPGLSAAPPESADVVRVGGALHMQMYAPVIQRLFEAAGLKATLSFFPDNRSLRMLETGELDAEAFRQAGALRGLQDKVRLVGPLGCLNVRAFFRRDSQLLIKSVADLSEWRIGISTGNRMAAEVVERLHLRHERVLSTDALMKMLVLGRLDAAIGDEPTILGAMARTDTLKVLEARGPVLLTRPTFLVLQQQLERWGPALDLAAASLIHSGEWQRAVGDIHGAAGLPRFLGLECL
jgi:hypothetical protein